MSEREQKQRQSKQKTPKGHDIPIPRRDEFVRNLRKVSKTDESQTKRRPK